MRMRVAHYLVYISAIGVLQLAAPRAAVGQSLLAPCKPCAGIKAADPTALAEALARGWRLGEKAVLYAGWQVDLESATAAEAAAGAAALRAAGATPWLALRFATPAPLAANAAVLDRELASAAALARAAGAGAWLQVLWQPAAEPAEARASEYAFLLKRAAVAITGASAEARVVTEPLAPDRSGLEQLYAAEIAAYVDGVALAPAGDEELAAALAALAELDPGRSTFLDALPYPTDPLAALADAAAAAARGFSATLFRAEDLAAADLAPLKALAHEFQGDLSYDPTSNPAGTEAWAFVRGEDLALRVVTRAPAAGEELRLIFNDPSISRVTRFEPASAAEVPLGGSRVEQGVEVRAVSPGSAALLRIERAAPGELEEIKERVTVTSERDLPVEEILRRLQAFEDAQARRLDHYHALNTTTLRFRVGGSAQGVEATFRGGFFFRRGEGFDWAWQDLLINGVRWRGKTIPEVPLVQPEKSAAMPLEILLTKEYRYRLRGAETLNGRDCWVVDFAPAGPAEGKRLYQGSVWIDRQIHARVRTRALQLGLEGDVISNEETLTYSPIDAQGAAAPWDASSYFLPLRFQAQQLLSIVNSATLVERDTQLTEVRINDAGFDEARSTSLASDVTMVRDTEKGLRYLVKDPETGERIVKEGFDTDKWFALGGVFYDDALDFPLPLAGVNYFSFDFKGSGQQLNLFFGGVLLSVDYADPNFLGSKFDAGADFFGIAFPLTDTVWRDDREREAEEVEALPASFGLTLGRPLGAYVKARLGYDLAWVNYGRTDATAPDFVLPSDTLTHSASLGLRLARGGYQLNLQGALHRRAEWEAWGLADNRDFDPDKNEYSRWEAEASKSWYPGPFQRLGLEAGYYSGDNLDRFSKYEFGFFGGTRVHGYQSSRVRAEEAWAAHLSYGFGLGEGLRLDAVADAAWATDEASRLSDELLAGVGLAGTFMGPWQTIINLDFGVPVAGPDDGFVVYVVFLKLFR